MRFRNEVETSKALNNNQPQRDCNKVSRLLIWQKINKNNSERQRGEGRRRRRERRRREPTIHRVREGGGDASALTLGAARDRKPSFFAAVDPWSGAAAARRRHQGQVQQRRRCYHKDVIAWSFLYYKLDRLLGRSYLLLEYNHTDVLATSHEHKQIRDVNLRVYRVTNKHIRHSKFTMNLRRHNAFCPKQDWI